MSKVSFHRWLGQSSPLFPLPTIRTCPHAPAGLGMGRGGCEGCGCSKDKIAPGLRGWRCYLETCRAVTTGFILKYCLNLSFAYLPRGERDAREAPGHGGSLQHRGTIGILLLLSFNIELLCESMPPPSPDRLTLRS